MKHHPTITSSGSRYWVSCECGWAYGSSSEVTAVHLAFGRHMVAAEIAERTAARDADRRARETASEGAA